ncbi:MAG: restriction endonuclease [Acidimicrobiaceae bacterium]|nr:restriction endonuclease [Acidimicrobiaceae bacterium]MYE98248.1 restriction endonuclease [Acidimicrobiaceae bacterium]MYI53052.1 restriction endonuclease [Acidimicrobiaceae bacterium]
MQSTSAFEATFDPTTKVYEVWLVLKDQGWHCRECEYTHIGITQIAGGSGIQGLQRGTKSRDGLKIESDNHLCRHCERTTRHDRWTGAYEAPIPGSSMPRNFTRRVINLLGSRDVVDGTERSPNHLTVDHKLPMIRWTTETEQKQTAYSAMSDDDIRENFQLLKKSNGSISHNQLKSRACERCFKTGKRGTPLGILFFYKGGSKWEPADKKDPGGCIGCGWYDFAEWRQQLNDRLNTTDP